MSKSSNRRRLMGISTAIVVAMAVTAPGALAHPGKQAQHAPRHTAHGHHRPPPTPPAVTLTPATPTDAALATAPWTVSLNSPASAPGDIFTAPTIVAAGGTGNQGPEITTGAGQPVWFDPAPAGLAASDFRVQTYEGKPVLTWWEGDTLGGAGHGNGTDYIADSSYHVIATVNAVGQGLSADQHEFLLTPQGTALIEIYNAVPYDLSSVGGPVDGEVLDAIVEEIDVATGQLLFKWDSLDHVPLSASYQPVPTTPGTAYDYFHINSVQLDNDGNLLISARHTWTVYKVDRHTGNVIWQLGGKDSSFTLGPGVAFAWQHNALAAGPDTVRIFDNESNGTPVLPQSRVIWVHLDLRHHTATLTKQIEYPGAGLSAPSQGNADALPNGDTFVDWGQLGHISEFNAVGNLVYDATLPTGWDSYRGYRVPWTGTPDGPPTATASDSSGSTTVDAIWNGATQVASWRILGGTSPQSLRPLGSTPWNGLDTAVTVNATEPYVEVQALDASGNVIATSPTTTATS
jgi:hypothetical protein